MPKLGNYEVTIKRSDGTELPTVPDDLPVIDFEGNAVSVGEAKKGYLRQQDYTKKTQGVAELQRLLKELGAQDDARGAEVVRHLFTKMNELEDLGVVDRNTGEIKVKAGQNTLDDGIPASNPSAPPVPPQLLKDLTERQRMYERDLGRVMAHLAEEDIKKSFPDFTPEDIQTCFKLAAINPQDTPMDHARKLSDRYKDLGQKAVDTHKKMEEEARAAGHNRPGGPGAAGSIFEPDVVITDRPDLHPGKKTISPAEASRRWWDSQKG